MTIPTYKLYIHPSDLIELRRDIWDDEPIPARLAIEKKKLEVDLAYRGSHIRKFKKKSYHITFYRPNMYRSAKEIHLNAEFKDPSYIRNKLSLDFFSDIGCLSPQSRHVFLSLNGADQGVYLELESVDEYFLVRRNLPEGAIFYAIDGDANFSLISDLDKEVKKSLDSGYEQKYGNEEDSLILQDAIIKINTIPREDFKGEIEKILDVDKYLRWLAGAVLTQNYDGFVHNYALYRNGETGLFEIIPWDYDATWGRDVHGDLLDFDYVPIEGYNTLTARILDIELYRKKYKDLLNKLLNHHFTLEYLNPKIESLREKIRPFILKDPYKKDKINQFDRESEVISEFIKNRSTYIKNKIYLLN